jgi:hypothetical protein
MKAQVDSADTDVVTILVCYDVPAAGRHFRKVLDGLINHFGDEIVFDVRLWRWDLLGASELSSEATADAMAATLLAIAYSGYSPPAEGFNRFIEQWAEEHASTDAMIVTMQAGAESNPVLEQNLRRLAGRHKVGFLLSARDDRSPEEDFQATRSSHSPLEVLPPFPRAGAAFNTGHSIVNPASDESL